MARSIEPYRDPRQPQRFSNWLEILRRRLSTIPCYTESDGSPEGVIAGQKGDRYYDLTNDLVYVKTTNTGNTGWALLGAGGGGGTLAGLTDTDLTGQAQGDLLFNADDTEWRDTAGLLQWDPAGQLTINVQNNQNALLLDGDMDDTTTPYIQIRNFGGQVERRILSILESGAEQWFLDADVDDTFEDNALVWGNTYTGGAVSPTLTLLADGRLVSAGSSIQWDPGADPFMQVDGRTVGGDPFIRLIGDEDAYIELFADDDNTGGELGNPYIHFRQDGVVVESSIGMTTANRDGRGNTFTDMPENGLAIHCEYSVGGIGIGVNTQCAITIDSNNQVSFLASEVVAGELAPTYFATPGFTTTELEDITDAVNTDDAKVEGSMVFNTTTNQPVWAVGNADGSVWVDATGATAHTPV